MKFITWHFLFSLTIATVFACNQSSNTRASEPATANSPDNLNKYVITSGKVGAFEVGKRLPFVDSLAAYSQQTRTRYTEEGPEEEKVILLYEEGKEAMTLKRAPENTSELSEIEIHSERYQTEEGIGVGSTITNFINTYPDYKLWYTYVSDRYVLETPQYPSVQFLLRKKDYNGGEINVTSEITPLQAPDFKPDATIESIRVY